MLIEVRLFATLRQYAPADAGPPGVFIKDIPGQITAAGLIELLGITGSEVHLLMINGRNVHLE